MQSDEISTSQSNWRSALQWCFPLWWHFLSSIGRYFLSSYIGENSRKSRPYRRCLIKRPFRPLYLIILIFSIHWREATCSIDVVRDWIWSWVLWVSEATALSAVPETTSTDTVPKHLVSKLKKLIGRLVDFNVGLYSQTNISLLGLASAEATFLGDLGHAKATRVLWKYFKTKFYRI